MGRLRRPPMVMVIRWRYIPHRCGGMVMVHGSDVLSHAVVYTCYAREAQLSVCCSQVCVMSLGATQSRWAGCCRHGSGN